jgi:hypothetical protein
LELQQLQNELFKAGSYEQDIAYPEVAAEVRYSRTHAIF